MSTGVWAGRWAGWLGWPWTHLLPWKPPVASGQPCVPRTHLAPPTLCKGGLPRPAPSRGQEIRDLALAFKLLLSHLQVRKLRPRKRGEGLTSQSKVEAGTAHELVPQSQLPASLRLPTLGSPTGNTCQ